MAQAIATGKMDRPARRPRPVIVYLIALLLVFLLPALVVSLVLLQRNNEAQEDVLRALTDATVQAIVQTVDREVSSMMTTLRVLATSQSLYDGDTAQFHERSLVALAGTGAYLVALDAEFNQLLNTRVAVTQPLGKMSDPVSAQRALERGVPTTSNLYYGATSNAYVFTVLLPVPENRTGAALLGLTQNATNLAGALQARQLPPGWHAALVDGDGEVIVASPDTGYKTGSRLGMRQIDDGSPPGQWRRELVDGQQIVTSEWRSGLTGWRVIAWTSVATVERPLFDSLLWLAAWGIVIGAVASAVAFVLAQQIRWSVQGLRRDAVLLGQGGSVEAKAYPVAEIAEVSEALALASQQRQAAERDVRFLMRELAHRSKNQMTVIAAMAKQTARGASDVPSYVQAFEKRILGLAQSTDLLLAHGRAGVALDELIERQLAPFSPSAGNRVTLNGPPVRLNMQAAQILGMAVHELATNAVKHGAFMGERGRLAVHWAIAGDRLDLNWRETTPTAPVETDRKGFGTTVLKSMVGGALGADVARTIHLDGIEWGFLIPLEAIDPAFALPQAEVLRAADAQHGWSGPPE